MQISNESFIGAPPKAADSLRPEHVHDSDDDTVSYIWSFRSSPDSVYTVILAVLTAKALRLVYWIMFLSFFEYSLFKSSQASYLPASPAMVDQCFVFSQDLGLLLWGLLFGR